MIPMKSQGPMDLERDWNYFFKLIEEWISLSKIGKKSNEKNNVIWFYKK